MNKIGTCSVCGKRGEVFEKTLNFSNVLCECCNIGHHQEKISVCMNCITGKLAGTTKIYYTGSVHNVPIKFLNDNFNLSPTEMKSTIKKEFDNNGV